MPTYEYICTKCGHQFDLFQPIKDDAITVCPKDKCARKPWAKGAVKRAITSGAGIIFKGSGFYITDYRSEQYKEAAKKDAAQGKPEAAGTSGSGGATGGSAGGSGSASSESKPAKTPAPTTEKKKKKED